MKAQHIVDDDPEFLRWIRLHSSGFVLNANTNPRATYLKLHTATCSGWEKTYTTKQPFTGRAPSPNGSGYSKIVGLSIGDLREQVALLGLKHDVAFDQGCGCLRNINLVSLGTLDDDEAWPSEPEIDSESDFIIRSEDSREIALCAVRLRRGQSSFRNALIERYGATCMVTGCDVRAVIEAAHIKPYRGDSDHHVSNGLLLRSDIHTLFDLNLVGVDPTSMRIVLHPALQRTPYGEYEGKLLDIRNGKRVSVEALSSRWSEFTGSCSAHKPGLGSTDSSQGAN